MQHLCTYPKGDLYYDGAGVWSILRFDAEGRLAAGHTFATLAEAHTYGLSVLDTAQGRMVPGVRWREAHAR